MSNLNTVVSREKERLEELIRRYKSDIALRELEIKQLQSWIMVCNEDLNKVNGVINFLEITG